MKSLLGFFTKEALSLWTLALLVPMAGRFLSASPLPHISTPDLGLPSLPAMHAPAVPAAAPKVFGMIKGSSPYRFHAPSGGSFSGRFGHADYRAHYINNRPIFLR